MGSSSIGTLRPMAKFSIAAVLDGTTNRQTLGSTRLLKAYGVDEVARDMLADPRAWWEAGYSLPHIAALSTLVVDTAIDLANFDATVDIEIRRENTGGTWHQLLTGVPVGTGVPPQVFPDALPGGIFNDSPVGPSDRVEVVAFVTPGSPLAANMGLVLEFHSGKVIPNVGNALSGPGW